MRYPTDVPVKIVMLGAGGTGGHIAPHLYRLLYALGRPGRFILCDGDIVERKNLIRQNFSPADLGENKARVLAERYASVFGMEAEYVPNFVENLEVLKALITPKEWQLDPQRYQLTKEMVILIGAVDNNRSRQLCHQAFCQAQDLIYIDSGNGEFSGQVVCGVRKNGHDRVFDDYLDLNAELYCPGSGPTLAIRRKLEDTVCFFLADRNCGIFDMTIRYEDDSPQIRLEFAEGYCEPAALVMALTDMMHYLQRENEHMRQIIEKRSSAIVSLPQNYKEAA